MQFFMKRGQENEKVVPKEPTTNGKPTPVIKASDQKLKQEKKPFQFFGKKPTYAFIDASNLFWGGEGSMGFKIDYKKLFTYLSERFGVTKIFYYGGVRIFDFEYNILDNKPLNFDEVIAHLEKLKSAVDEKEILAIDRSINKLNFYKLLQSYGYTMKIKPAKVHFDEDDDKEENPILKANCDVDMTFDIMRLMPQYSNIVIMTGDGDFAALFAYLKTLGRKLTIFSRPHRTAKEIHELAGDNYVDFESLRRQISYNG